jgi:hypothetical protein
VKEEVQQFDAQIMMKEVQKRAYMMKVPDRLQNSMNEVEHGAFGGGATVSI